MVKFIKVKDKYSNTICWINVNHIQCIKQVADVSVIVLDQYHNVNIVVDKEPSYIFSLIHGETPSKNSNI